MVWLLLFVPVTVVVSSSPLLLFVPHSFSTRFAIGSNITTGGCIYCMVLVMIDNASLLGSGSILTIQVPVAGLGVNFKNDNCKCRIEIVSCEGLSKRLP